MDIEPFDKKNSEKYAAQARKDWGATPEYREFEAKNSGKTPAEVRETGDQLMALLAEFGAMKDRSPAAPEVQAQVLRVQDFITAHYYYTCSKEMLGRLGRLYGSGGEFTENIDRAGGEGTAVFAAEAIRCYTAE